MSPEQVTHRQLDGRSDLFSVGVVLWEILTGERLFWQHDHQTTIDRVLNRRIPRPSSLYRRARRSCAACSGPHLRDRRGPTAVPFCRSAT
jgi:serine/threonine-protein kinase